MMPVTVSTSSDEETAPRASLLFDLVIGLACFIVLMATSPALPLVWDEPNAIERADQLTIWLKLCLNPDPKQSSPWSDSSIRYHCRYTTVIEGHPDFYGFVISLGRSASAGWLPLKESYRFGPILLFAIATGVFSHRLRQQQGSIAAVIAVICLMSMPRLFAHAHTATIDGPLTACWMMTWATFDWARRSKLGCLIWGVALGLTFSCKFTGWLAIGGFLAWSLLYKDRIGLRVCVIGCILACVTFVNINPILWSNPVAGMVQFFSLNLHRSDHGLNIPIQFFGTQYDLHRPLPWYNSIVWVLLTVPVGTILLAAVSSVRSIRTWRLNSSVIMLLLQAGVLIVVKALPQSPPHDAERLFLPSFPFLAALAGVGGAQVWKSSRFARWPAWAPRLTLAVALLTGIAETAWYSPQWLCYYSPAIGGLRGAAQLGLEPTYYWDGLDEEVLTWLQSESAPDTRAYVSVSIEYIRALNQRANSPLTFSTSQPGQCDWYVVQNRPGLWTAVDRELINSQTPLFTKTIRDPTWGTGPWRLNVPVVYVFSHEQWSLASRSISP